MFRALQGQQGQTRQDQGLGMVRNPSLPPLLGVSGGQFGQLGRGQVSGPSLEEVLSQRGFKIPEKSWGAQPAISVMYKDSITGKMKTGGPFDADYAKSMGDFYAKNPEALNIAKQHQKSQQYKPVGFGDLHQGPPKPPQEIMPGVRPPPEQTRLPGGTSYEDMRFTNIPRVQPAFHRLGQEPPTEMFHDRLTGKQVTQEQVDSFGGMETRLTPSQRSSVLERDRAGFHNMRNLQDKAAQKNMSGRGDSGGLPAVALPDYLAGIRAENKTRQDKINSGELVRDPNQRDRGPPRYITKAEADALRPTNEEPVFGGQTGGGIGGLQQFMQIMQMIMQMVQQSQGRGMGGMGMGGMNMGGMRRNNFSQPQGFGGFNQYQSRQQYNPQFQQNFGSPYGPY